VHVHEVSVGQPSPLLAIIRRNAAGDVTAIELVARPAGTVEEQIAELAGQLER
jgi:hypothetical protein